MMLVKNGEMMKSIQTLEELKKAVDDWRKHKIYRSQSVHPELLAEARKLLKQYGLKAVMKCTGFHKEVLQSRSAGRSKVQVSINKMPSYTRFEMIPPVVPLAEAELPGGVKLRLFSLGSESVAFLRSLSIQGELS